MKSGNLNFQETSGPLQARNGTALSLPLGKSIQPEDGSLLEPKHVAE
jgi:hypothetical protein